MASKTGRFPEFGDVLFSLKTFIAAMLALGIALCFDLQNPYWAVGTVYIVSHPLSGASTSKRSCYTKPACPSCPTARARTIS